MPLKSCTGVTGHETRLGTQKPWVIDDGNGQKMKTVSFYDAPEMVYGGSRDVEIAARPKNMSLCPWKRPKNMKTPSSDDTSENM